MNRKWPKVRLETVLTRVSRPVLVEPTTIYHVLGARWYAKGLYTKQILPGSELQARNLYRVEQGDFVYNRLFGWKGSFALATKENSGCYVSNEFPCFIVRPDLASGKYIWRYFSLPAVWNEVLKRSAGGTPTSRNRLKEEQFLDMDLPLPPLEEQMRIVARIEEIAGQIREVRSLRDQVLQDANALCFSILGSDKRATLTPMNELVRLRSPDVTVLPDQDYEFAGVLCFGGGVFRSQTKRGIDFAYPRLTRVRAGEFVYPKLMAWEGAFGIVPPGCDGCVVSTEFPVFEVLQDKVFPEVLDIYFRNPAIWPDVAGESTGTNVRRRRLNPRDFLKYKIPLPNHKVQERVRQVKAEIEAIKLLQTDSQAELDALLPAVLDRAFKGEL